MVLSKLLFNKKKKIPNSLLNSHQKRKDLTKNGNIKSNSLKKLHKNTIILNIGDESLEKKSSSRLNISFGEFNEKQNTFIVFLKVLGR